jgi:hypothetical protein
MVLVCLSNGAGTGWDILTLLARSVSDWESETDRAESGTAKRAKNKEE